MSKISKIHQRVNTPAEQRAPVGQIEIPVNTFWDDAQNVYRVAMSGIQRTHGELANYLSAFVNDPEAMERVPDMNELLANINLLNRDIQEHMERLTAIYDRHKDRTGGTQTPDDNMHVIQIHGLYADQMSLYDSTITPTVTHIYEQCGITRELLAVEKAKLMEQQAAALLDTSVISDVAVKEVPQITAEQHAEALKVDQEGK